MSARPTDHRGPPAPATFQGRPVLVLGAGRSGRAAAAQLSQMGARVTLYDRDPERLRDLPAGWTAQSGASLPDADAFDWIVQSPGVPVAPDARIVPEIDLAALRLAGPCIGITGTNGKSTTTVLIGDMLRQSGIAVEVGGNLGTPLCALADTQAAFVVVELSSFQLEHARWLHPRIGVLLNLADDHFDRHPDLATYAACKARLATLLEPEGTLVCNLDDAWAAETSARAGVHTLSFSVRARPPRGAYLSAGELVLAPAGEALLRVPLDALTASCRAHPGNALAAMLAAFLAGATPLGIRAALESFRGLSHRAQPVGERGGVTYVDDSKATNPAAAIASLATALRPIVWLGGGYGKGLDFGPLARAAERARLVIVFGRAGPELARALSSHPEVVQVDRLADAVREAARRAQPGDVVLLSPACASFDEFKSFEERGDLFAKLVQELPC